MSGWNAPRISAGRSSCQEIFVAGNRSPAESFFAAGPSYWRQRMQSPDWDLTKSRPRNRLLGNRQRLESVDSGFHKSKFCADTLQPIPASCSRLADKRLIDLMKART
jgi:hypothetical protein